LVAEAEGTEVEAEETAEQEAKSPLAEADKTCVKWNKTRTTRLVFVFFANNRSERVREIIIIRRKS